MINNKDVFNVHLIIIIIKNSSEGVVILQASNLNISLQIKTIVFYLQI